MCAVCSCMKTKRRKTNFSGIFSATFCGTRWTWPGPAPKIPKTFSGTLSRPSPEPSPEPCWTLMASGWPQRCIDRQVVGRFRDGSPVRLSSFNYFLLLGRDVRWPGQLERIYNHWFCAHSKTPFLIQDRRPKCIQNVGINFYNFYGEHKKRLNTMS